MNQQAEELNNILKNTVASRVLSDFGKKAFFPKSGIISQSTEAKGTKLNATLGQAFEDDGDPMVLSCFSDQVKLGKASLLYSL